MINTIWFWVDLIWFRKHFSAYSKGTNFIGGIVERDGGRFTGCLDELDVVAAREGIKETKRLHQQKKESVKFKKYFLEVKI